MSKLIFIRDFLVYNFSATIKQIQYKQFKITNSFFFHFLRLIPFCILISIFNFFRIKYVYELDDMYFSNYTSNTHIKPVILDFSIIVDNNKVNLIETIKKYNLSIPIDYFIINHPFIENNDIEFKYLTKGKIIKKVIQLDRNNNQLLEDIFNI
jgi:hypothetical protein